MPFFKLTFNGISFNKFFMDVKKVYHHRVLLFYTKHSNKKNSEIYLHHLKHSFFIILVHFYIRKDLLTIPKPILFMFKVFQQHFIIIILNSKKYKNINTHVY